MARAIGIGRVVSSLPDVVLASRTDSHAGFVLVVKFNLGAQVTDLAQQLFEQYAGVVRGIVLYAGDT